VLEVIESYVTKIRDNKAALRFMTKALKHHGFTTNCQTDKTHRSAALAGGRTLWPEFEAGKGQLRPSETTCD
jgi:transposase-like protein